MTWPLGGGGTLGEDLASESALIQPRFTTITVLSAVTRGVATQKPIELFKGFLRTKTCADGTYSPVAVTGRQRLVSLTVEPTGMTFAMSVGSAAIFEF